ncbi:MAG: hypothetical protein KAU95_01615 [Candidatus Aenigmarchaeota archaeon]|nr:hypothetical protein [Candidatus Aenigmarchaeota archaeon]
MEERIEKGEFVVAEVIETHSNSVELNLVEYDLKGFLNVSNIPGLWIRSLKKNVKKGQLIVGKVIKIDRLIELSLKGVSKIDKERKIKEFSREKKSVKLFNRVCGEYEVEDNKVKEELAKLKDEFGGIYESLEKIRDGEEVGLGEEFSDVINRFKTGLKTYEFKGELELHSNSGNGAELIKQSLLELNGVDAIYIGNTKFLLKLKTTNPKKGEKNLTAEAEKVISKIKSLGGSGEFKLLQK